MAREMQTWALTPASRDPRGVLYLGAAAGTLAAAPVVWMLLHSLDPVAPPVPLGFVFAPMLVVGVLLTALALRLMTRQSVQTITVGPEGVEIVGSPTSPLRVRRIPFGRIASIEPGRGGEPSLVLFPRGWSIPVAIGGKGTDPELLADVSRGIRDGIAKLPDGAQQLAGIDARARASAELVGRVPAVTAATELLVIFALGLQWATSCVPLRESCGAMALVNAPKDVAAGEVYRLLTANLLHADEVHLVLNLMGLAALGTFAELALGWRRTALLFVVGGIAAQAVGSVWGGFDYVIGASGIVYASLGALLWIGLCRHEELPGRLRLVHVTWILVVLGVLLELLVPRISSATHIGGFVAGFVVTPLLVGRGPLFRR